MSIGWSRLRYILELPPFSKSLIDRVAPRVGRVFDAVFVPSAPAGAPLLDSLATSVYLTTSFGLRTIFSIRLRDVNLNHVLEKVKVAEEFGLYGVLLTQGDPPKYGAGLSGLPSEEAMKYIRGEGIRVRLGLVVSLRYPVESIARRLEQGPDFVFVIHYGPSSREKLREVCRIASRGSSEVYPFLLLGVGRSRGVFDRLGQEYFTSGSVKEALEELRGLASGVVVSSPLDIESAVELFETMERLLQN
jgi:5,10-methylenetetrahydrofolate reductase